MYSQTLQTLSAKLQTSNKLSLQQRRRLQEESQLKLLAIESMLKDKKVNEAEEVAVMKEKLGCVSRLCEETVRNFGVKSEKEQELVAVLREELENEIDQQQKQHQDKVQSIVQASQAKLQQLISQHQNKTKPQKATTHHLLTHLSKTLTTLQTTLTQQKQTRQQNCLKITSQIQQQITHFHQVIQKQKEKRMASQRKLNSMMQEIEKKVRGEIETQAEKRKKNNQALLRLIEVACNKLEEVTNG